MKTVTVDELVHSAQCMTCGKPAKWRVKVGTSDFYVSYYYDYYCDDCLPDDARLWREAK